MRRARARAAVKLALAAAATVALSLTVWACGGTIGGIANNPVEVAESNGPPEGDVTISNWPGYIQPNEGGEPGTISQFEKATGIKVDYIEDVNDNNEFFGKMRPLLEQGESGGRSIFVVTDWMAKEMYDFHFLQEIEPSSIPEVFKNLVPNLKNPKFDPGRKFSIPWQTGMTGIWVDESKAPEIKSVNDLFDPKYKGKVTMLQEMRDTVPLVMKAEGVDFEEATDEDWLKAIEKIEDAAASGQIRRFTGNDYTEELTAGNIVAAIGWSGDASIVANPDAEWIMPEQGCVIWSDNMVIPIGAPNVGAAFAFMDFVYEPEVAAGLTEYITYISPVKGVQELVPKELADDPLVFPSPEFQKSCSIQGSPPDPETVSKAWANVVAG